MDVTEPFLADSKSKHTRYGLLERAPVSSWIKHALYGFALLNILIFCLNLFLIFNANSVAGRLIPDPDGSFRALSDLDDDLSFLPHTDKARKLIDGRLFTLNTTSAWDLVGPPSRTTDALWDELSAEGHEIILVNASTLRQAGFDPARYFSAPLSWNFGPDMYPVQIDVFHQIHCLDVLRKHAHFDHYFPDGKTDWQHFGHCLHILLQNVQCHADIEVIPHRWVEKDPMPFAQFSIGKRCRDFGAVKEWNLAHSRNVTHAMWQSSRPLEESVIWPGYGEGY